jgi:DNA-binding protein Fis
MQALETADGNQTEAARILSISRDRLRYKLKKHNLYMPDSGRASAAAG